MLTRRRLMLLGPSLALAGLPGGPIGAQPTPVCGAATLAQTEGPFFKTRSPLRADLREMSLPGQAIRIAGRVLDRACRPLAQAKLDFWQADAAGAYDNAGFRLRGHQFTDSDGRFVLDTILPSFYPGRTRHIYVKAQQANGPVLTTQLYFPEEAANARDPIFRSALVVKAVAPAQYQFDFVL